MMRMTLPTSVCDTARKRPWPLRRTSRRGHAPYAHYPIGRASLVSWALTAHLAPFAAVRQKQSTTLDKGNPLPTRPQPLGILPSPQHHPERSDTLYLFPGHRSLYLRCTEQISSWQLLLSSSLVKKSLDLHFLLPDPMCFVPMQLGHGDSSVGKANGRITFELAPSTKAELLAKPHDVPNAAPTAIVSTFPISPTISNGCSTSMVWHA
jgi:hypothetical protein